MINSYLIIALRNFFRNKLTTFINVFGLGLSMSVGLMILIRFQDAVSYDTFHPFPERTYRITTDYKKKNSDKWSMASTSLPLGNLLQKNSNIESVVNLYPALNGKATTDGKELYINGAFTEPAFFRIFGFALIYGNAATALQQPNSIVLSKTTAEKFYGNDNAIGQVIKMENGTSFIITGIMNTAPGKSHLNYDAYASYSSVAADGKRQAAAGKIERLVCLQFGVHVCASFSAR